MNPKFLLTSAVVLLSACAPANPPQPPADPAPQESAPVRTSITDMDAFNAYIATRPTPDALKAKYPGLTVVMPGDISTRELRGDNSRYFAEVDAEGRVTGGQFQ